MKRISIAVIGLVLICWNPIKLLAQNVSFGVRTGVNFSRLASLDETGIKHDRYYPDYNYPYGYNLGLIFDFKFHQNFYMRTELSLIHIISEVEVSGSLTPLKKEFKATYIHIPFFLKLKSNKSFLPYLLIGPNIGYVIKARYYYCGVVEIGPHTYQITNDLPSFDFAFVFGIGKEFKFIATNFLGELKFMLGLNQNSYYKAGTPLGSWRNNIFQLGLGIMLR